MFAITVLTANVCFGLRRLTLFNLLFIHFLFLFGCSRSSLEKLSANKEEDAQDADNIALRRTTADCEAVPGGSEGAECRDTGNCAGASNWVG